MFSKYLQLRGEPKPQNHEWPPGLWPITSTPQVQDVQDVKTSVITRYLVITGYTVILPRKPSTKLGESLTWFLTFLWFQMAQGLSALVALGLGLLFFFFCLEKLVLKPLEMEDIDVESFTEELEED